MPDLCAAVFFGLGLAASATSNVSTRHSAREMPDAKVDALFAAWAKPDVPGAALAVIKDGRVIYEKSYGMADLERNVPINSTTVFDIGSTSKQFTAMSVFLLAQQGKLSLDDDIRQYVPELPRYPERVNIRHLLHHTSGIRDYLDLLDLAGLREENEYSEGQIIDLLARQEELNFPPGEAHLYSNSGYFLLAVVVKRATGKTLRTFAEENIFRPLGMTHTHFHDDFTEIVKNRAIAYQPRPKDGFALDVSLSNIVGDGCLFTTVADLAKWDQNFYDNRLAGGRHLTELMQTPGKLNNGTVLSYASGLVIEDYRGLPTVSHGGAWSGYRAELLRFPTHRFSVIIVSNRADSDPSALARKIAEIYLGDQLAAEKVQAKPEARPTGDLVAQTPPLATVDVTPKALADLGGAYASKELGVTYRLSVDDGSVLLANGMSLEIVPLRPSKPDEFHALGRVLRFERNDHQQIVGFRLDSERVKNLKFVKQH